jgi:hypothetical protein
VTGLRFKLAVALLGCAVLWLPAAASGATLKDDFAAREKVQGLPVVVSGSNVGADRETGEPVLKPLSPAGHSVWLEWEATGSGYVTVSACGSTVPTVTGVYLGDELEDLFEEGSESEFGGSECSGIRNGVTFFALSGFEYEIAVDGNSFFVPPALPPVTEGAIELRIEATPPPANNDFANAAPLQGTIFEEPGGARFYFASAFGYNWAADKEFDEPDHAGDIGGRSVWYSWVAPESGTARIGLCCGAPDLLGVYSGVAVDQLSEVRSGRGSLEVPVTAGSTYRIAVDGHLVPFFEIETDKFELSISMQFPSRTPPAGGGPPPPVDVDAPNTTIFKKVIRPKARSASLSFRSSEPGSTFRCRLDGRKATACTSPKRYAGLAPGRHKFEVVAADAAGNADPTAAVSRFKVPKPKKAKG